MKVLGLFVFGCILVLNCDNDMGNNFIYESDSLYIRALLEENDLGKLSVTDVAKFDNTNKKVIGIIIDSRTISKDSFKMFPKGLLTLSELKWVQIVNCGQFRNLPKEIYLLPNLEELTINQTSLAFISGSIKNMHKLNDLSLRNNKILLLPKEIGMLKNLRYLDVRNNRLIYLPKEIKNMNITINR